MNATSHAKPLPDLRSRFSHAIVVLGLALAVLPALVETSAHAALVGRWVADDWPGGTANWVDRVAGRTATVLAPANSPVKTPGVLPHAGLVFDGVDDYFSVAATQNPIVGKTSVTIVAFFLTTQGASGTDGFFWRHPGPLNGEAPADPNDWGLTYNAAGNAQGFFNYGITPTPAVSLIDGQPHTMVLTWQDPTTFPGQGVARLFVDGILAGTNSQAGSGVGIVTNGFVIGSEAELLQRYFSGAIGELRFYDSIEDPAALHTEITTYHEVTTSADSGSGSLRDTIAAANPGDTIIFAEALSGQSITLTTGQILIDKNLTLDASALPDGITVSGNYASRVFEIAIGTTVAMKGVTITHGHALIAAGFGQLGGGILNQGILTLQRCRLVDNAAVAGGGGVFTVNGHLTFEDSTLSRNSTGGSGGGVFLNLGTHRFTGCTFAENTAGSKGGGIGLLDGDLAATNCTVSGNSAGSRGGGLDNEGGSIGNAQAITMVNSTVSGNSAPLGSGIFNFRAVNLVNTIVAGNVPSPSGGTDIHKIAGVGLVNSSGANLIGNHETVEAEFPAGPLVGTAASPLNPQLAPLADYGGPTPTAPPLPSSPAIDAATNGLATDQRGLARPEGSNFDIGAVEFLDATVTTSADEDAVDPGAGLSLREAMVLPFVSTITFDPAVFNGEPADTITLTNGQLTVAEGLVIDASAISGGVTLSGNNASRVFEVASGASLMLDSLTITGGRSANGSQGATGQDGGASQPGGPGGLGGSGAPGGGILNQGKLTLHRVTLSGNTAGNGGKGGNGGNGVVQGRGGKGGTGGAGGAIYNTSSGTLTVLNSTIANNASGTGGPAGSGTPLGDGGNGGTAGGIGNAGILRLTHTTVTDNTSGAPGSGGAGNAGSGGGVLSTGTLALTNTLVALNTAAVGNPDLLGSATSIGGVNFIGNPAGATGLGVLGNDYFTGNPMLLPLGNYGGPNQTRPPLSGSPTINAASFGLATDQRGLTRPQGPTFDIGAVEMEFLPVANNADNGPGSLRQTIAEAANHSGIEFAAGLSGETITLSSGQITFDKSLTIDASALPGGMIISGNNASRVFEIGSGHIVDLDSLTITGGNTSSPGGGGVYNQGTLFLDHVSLTNNFSSHRGGAINNYLGGTLVLNNSTVAGNTATDVGGGMVNLGSLTAINSTLAGNTSLGTGGGQGFGGAIFNFDFPLTLIHCTISSNTATTLGGGLRTQSGAVTVTNTIIARNAAATGADIANNDFTSFSIGGTNLIGDNSTVTSQFPAGPLVGTLASPLDPQLALLGNYGGPTPTRPPLVGSPAIDAAVVVPGITADQRGFPRVISWTNDFSSGLGGAGVLTSGVDPATGTLDGGSFLLTPEVGNQWASLILPDLGQFSIFSAAFDLYFSDGGVGPADGFSFSFGPAPASAVGEDGIASGHVISFDTHPANVVIRYIRKTGSPINIASTTTFHRFNDANQWHHVTVSLDPDGRLTVTFKGITVLENIDTGYTYAAGDRFTFGARTGGFNSEQRVDNIGIVTGPLGVLTDIGAVDGAFVPAGSTLIVGPTLLGDGSVQLVFTNSSGATFTVLATSDLTLPLNLWSNLGPALEIPPGSGEFQFTDPQATNHPQRYYGVQSP